MPRITAMTPAKRDPTRLVIKVDGKIVGRLSQSIAYDMGLQIDLPWDDALAAKVERAVAYDGAMKAALQRLNRRALSASQLRRKLREKEHDPIAIDQVVARLEELGAIDDEAFGRSLIEGTLQQKAAGPRLLSQKLMQKGLDRKLIDRLIREYAPEPDDAVAAAMDLARKKLRTLTRFDEQTQQRRLWGLLARRGFESEIINRAVSKLMNSDEQDG
jgi:regulatory protein